MNEPQPGVKSVRLAGMVVDAAGVVGACLVTAGAGEIYRPSAFIVGGMFVLIAAWLMARKGV